MTERKVVVDNEGGRELDDHYIGQQVILGRERERVLIGEMEDPFARSPEVFKTMGGTSAAFKKKASRAFEKAASGQNGARSKKVEIEATTGYDLFGVVEPPYNLEYLTALYTASSPHYAAVNAKVANIVGLGYDFVDSHKTRHAMDKAEGNEAKVKRMRQKLSEAKDELFDWLDNINSQEEFDEVMNNVYIDFESTGNGYFEIGRTASGQVGYIGHIPSKTMRIRKDRDGFVQIISNKATYFRNFGEDTPNPISNEEPNEIIHLKKYSPSTNFYGVPDIIAAMQSVTGNEFAARFNLDYFENKAVPRYVVVIKGGTLGPQSQKTVVDFFETSLKGSNHRTLFIPLPADEQDRKHSFEMKPVEAGTQDASFVNYDKINLRNILMAEKVPMTKVGVAEGVNLAVARDADKTFKEQVCRPAQRILEKKLGRVFAEKTDMFRFKLNELTLTDEDTQSKIDERYLRMQVLLPNEVRARWGKSGIKGGDKVVDLKAQSDAASVGNRQRDAERSANATDSAGEGRNTKGDGRKTP